MTIAEGKPVVFDSIKIRDEVLLCTARGHKLAIVIVPLDTICKSYTAKPYGDIATLVLTFTEEAFFRLIDQGGTLQELLNEKVAKLYWISNPLIENSLPVILKQRQEWEKNREQKSREDKQKNLSAERLFNPTQNRRYSLGRKEAQKLFSEPTYNDVIYDSFGMRWVKGIRCGHIAPGGEFTYVGGYDGL